MLLQIVSVPRTLLRCSLKASLIIWLIPASFRSLPLTEQVHQALELQEAMDTILTFVAPIPAIIVGDIQEIYLIDMVLYSLP